MDLEKILDGPNVGYCSDSDDDLTNSAGLYSESQSNGSKPDCSYNQPQTGPKGVIADFKKHKEALDKSEKDYEEKVLQIANKFTIANPKNVFATEEDDELEALRKKRLEQLKKMAQGRMKEIPDKVGFLAAIDENLKTPVFIHIYKDGDENSHALDEVLLEISYTMGEKAKFFKVKSTLLGTSQQFTRDALPVLQIYIGGNLQGNFVRLHELLDQDLTKKNLMDLLDRHNISVE